MQARTIRWIIKAVVFEFVGSFVAFQAPQGDSLLSGEAMVFH